MPYNGSGTYSAPSLPGSFNPAVSGQPATPTAWNALLADISAALSMVVTTDGQSSVTQDIPFGGHKLTDVGDATAKTDAATAEQVTGSVLDYGADSGTATAYVIAPPIAITAYSVGQRVAFTAANANSGTAPTLAVSGLAAGVITNPDGSALGIGDIAANAATVVQVATLTPTFHLISMSAGLVRKGGTQTISGAKTFSSTLTMSGAAINEAVRVDVASAGTTDIGAAAANYLRITGTTTITGLGTIASGVRRKVVFAGALILTHNGTSLILPTGTNITTAAGDCAEFESEGAGNWRCTSYQLANGQALAVSLSRITASLGGNVALNNVATYFDGPSIAQGTTGTWFVSGTVTVYDPTAANAQIYVRLWDGTTGIASAVSPVNVAGSGVPTAISLSGIITSPAGNLRISCKDISSVNGQILFNQSGDSKDSTITAVRLA